MDLILGLECDLGAFPDVRDESDDALRAAEISHTRS